MEWQETSGIRRLEAELPGARAAFSTRGGGSSEQPFDTLNLGILTGDDPVAVGQNRRRLAEALGRDPAAVVMARQVHGAEIAAHDAPQAPSPYAQPGSPLPEADGHLLGKPGLAAVVLVADC